MYHSHRLLATGFLVAMAFGASGNAYAQGNPSADQIINSLKPGGNILGGTRGIRPVAPSSEPASPPPAAMQASPAPSQSLPAVSSRTPAPVQHAATPPVRPVSAPSVNLTVQFANNSAELTPAATKTLTELGRALSSESLASYRFRIEGHTDTVGAPDANKALSDRRAQAVVAFLAEKFKIDPSRLQPVGMGEDGLLVQTPQNVAEPRNRRVQVINLGA